MLGGSTTGSVPNTDTASCKVSDCQLLHSSVSCAQWFHYRLSSQRPTQQASKSASTPSSVSCAQWSTTGSVPTQRTQQAAKSVTVNSFIHQSPVPSGSTTTGSVPNGRHSKLQSQRLSTPSSVSCAQWFQPDQFPTRTQQLSCIVSVCQLLHPSVSCAHGSTTGSVPNAADTASWTESECQLARPLTQPCVVVPLEAISVGNTLPVERSIIVQFVIHLRPLIAGQRAYRVCGRLAFFQSSAGISGSAGLSWLGLIEAIQ